MAKIPALLAISIIIAGAIYVYNPFQIIKNQLIPPTIKASQTPPNIKQSNTTTLSTTLTKSFANETPMELRIFAAGSLANLVKHTKEKFEKENNAKILFNFASSDALYTQIYSGSPADIYMSADYKWTNKLKTEGLLDNDQYWNFTTNKLIVILPEGNPKNITSLLDLAQPKTKIVVGAWTIPAGKYVNMTLTKIQKTWGNRSDPHYKGPQWDHYRDRVVNNIVSYEPMVTNVVTKVIMGICDAGIAFVSDAKFQGSRLRYLEIPSSVNTIGTYGIAIIKDSTHRYVAVNYVNFWLSDEGQKILLDFGFSAD